MCQFFSRSKATFINFYTVLLVLIIKTLFSWQEFEVSLKKQLNLKLSLLNQSEKFKIIGASAADRFFIIRKNHRGNVLWTASVTEWLNVCWFYPWLSNSSLNHKIVWIYDSSYQRWVRLLTKLLNLASFFIDSHRIKSWGCLN
jgi:hypothetical protein